MASPVQPGTRSPALDGPPAPSGGPTGPTPGAGGMADVVQGGSQSPSSGDRQGGRRAIVMMGAEIDRALVALAQAFDQLGMRDGLDGLAQARALIETSIAQAVAGAGEGGGMSPGGPPSTSPTAAGPQFPGGGSMSGKPY